MRPLRSLLCVGVVSLFLLAPSALATWSIVLVNTRTGEVAIGSATCLDGFDLEFYLPVVVPGHGAAAAQSVIDMSGVNRRKLWDFLHEGADPHLMLTRLQAFDGAHQSRQYGIADFTHAPATFTGNQCADARYGVAGVVDDLRYSIQGNILAGVLPVYAAEEALLSTPGDLSQKLVAAMEAARASGGDGRCSCSLSAPTSCGAPPPNFTYSAYTGFLIVARMGDGEGACNSGVGCANGSYYLNLNAICGPGGPEPVLLLETAYASWRAALAGVPDHIQSRIVPEAQSMPADGGTRTFVDVELRDVNGGPVTLASSLTLEQDAGNPDVVLSPIQDLGGAHYRFALGAGLQPGTARVRVIAHQLTHDVRLWPDLVVRLDPVQQLNCGWDELSASTGAHVPLVVNFGAAHAGAPYLILASASGTVPGSFFAGANVPLNSDALFNASINGANGPRFVHTLGALNPSGRAQGSYVVPALALAGAIGQHFDFAAIKLASPSGVAFASNADGFLIVP